MDEDLFSLKAVKSFRNAHNKFGKFTSYKIQARDKDSKDYELLTTKNAVKFLLEGSLKYKVCRFCLSIASQLSEPDEIFEVARKGAIYKVTLRDMIACVHPFKVASDPNFPDKVCSRCVENAISSYLFSQQCERSERALRNCFEDMYEKLEKLDPLERKKRGRQKANPNPNVLYTEHEKVVDYAEPIINIINIGSTSYDNDTNISELECAKCWQVLPDVESLLNHESLHPKSMWYSCRLCGQSFVKHRQYKKHIKEAHLKEYVEVPVSNSTCFRCNNCGLMSNSLNQHLQHMEKHKFKTTLEHLLNRDMDKLCAVCLEKGSCMIHLNETLHLNGGYPGLTDEQSICNIMSATLPERKSYKYQELLIPTKASIMTIVKRMKCSSAKNITVLCDNERKMFQFCDPIILSTLNIRFDTPYLYTLSGPLFLNEMGIPFNRLNPFTTSNTDANGIVISINNVERNTNSTDFNSTFEETIVIDENYQTDENSSHTNYTEETNQIGSCKACWVFHKTSCQNCFCNTQNSTDASDRESVTNDQKKCKYCWLFVTVGKCQYCKKVLIADIESDKIDSVIKEIDTKIAKSIDVSNDIVSAAKEQKNVSNIETLSPQDVQNTRKRKSSLEITESPKLKWQCRICLTNNDRNRQTCFCCDFDTCNLNSNMKFNFGANKDVFESSKIQNDTTQKLREIIEKNEVMTNAQSDTTARIEKCIPETILDIQDAIDPVPMDIEITAPLIAQIKNDLFMIESMDVSCEEDSDNQENPGHKSPLLTSVPITDTVNSITHAHKTMMFQFTIGSGNSGLNNARHQNRRIMRPLRRTANKGHK